MCEALHGSVVLYNICEIQGLFCLLGKLVLLVCLCSRPDQCRVVSDSGFTGKHILVETSPCNVNRRLVQHLVNSERVSVMLVKSGTN